ncbi:MAG TPA: hybrid sensor histidine kinase/response regulator [Polyangiaceae bacterium]|nr:hybrid sensor histidine kinase/response regulator [Polyangiaceae bacterium]
MKNIRSAKPVFLLVDDKPENLLALEALLRRDDLEIVTALSGQEALEIILRHDIGLAIVDVQMPEMNGLELAELMRGSERSKRIPIIFITAGMHDRDTVFTGYDSGAVDFLHKPIDPRILKNKVETFYQLCKQRLELTETLRFHETFVATVGHDLKNPLNSIVMASQILASQMQDGKQQELVVRIRRSAQRMASMIDELYDLSRCRLDGGLALRRRSVELAPAIKRVVDEHRLSAHVPIEFHEQGSASAHCDDVRMTQMISNLIGNAVKHGTPGAPVTVRLTVTDERVEIAVHNDGVIAEDVRKSLFDPFVSSDRKSAGKDGLGLGLYIVEQIVRAHDGTIEVRSTPEEGTTFIVRVPREDSNVVSVDLTNKALGAQPS